MCSDKTYKNNDNGNDNDNDNDYYHYYYYCYLINNMCRDWTSPEMRVAEA